MKIILKTLKEYWKFEGFRPLQEEIINHYVSGKDTLVLLPTGGGKSLCYQLPALLKEGMTLVISPLISLMQDQVNQMNAMGIKSMFFQSNSQKFPINQQMDNARFGKFKLIYCSPERLLNADFISQLKLLPLNGIAVDEAHCISEWGHDFRPAFKSIKGLKELFPNLSLIALTASATPIVLEDIKKELNLIKPKVFTTSFERKNLCYETLQTEDKIGTLIKYFNNNRNPAIVYCRSRVRTEQVTQQLKNAGLKCDFFHGGLSTDIKKEKLDDWISEKNLIMVATSAFGMGIDKSNVGTVVHLLLPESMEAYYQETGRAGRDGTTAKALLLLHPSDYDRLKDQFLSHLPDTEFIKKCFSNLCSYLQIPYGEGEGLQYQLNLKEFSSRYKLNTKKSFETFKILSREGVFELVQVYQNKTKVQMICSQNQALDTINQGGKTAVVVQYLMRTYEDVFNNEQWVKLDEISKRTGFSQSEILKIFNNLFQNKNIDLQIHNTDLELFWNVPREDQYTLNPFLNNIKEYNRIKVQKVQTMIDYASETERCKRNMILNYFGEKKRTKCKQCSSNSCRSEEPFPKELFQLIINLLKTGPKSAYKIGVSLPAKNEFIVLALQQLQENNTITQNDANQFYLNDEK